MKMEMKRLTRVVATCNYNKGATRYDTSVPPLLLIHTHADLLIDGTYSNS